MKAPLPIKLDDIKAEQSRRDHAEKIVEIQAKPFVQAGIVTTKLVDSVSTPVAHKLGKTPSFVGQSIIRGAVSAGFIVETKRDDQFVYLTASGYGATITIDLQVT